MPFLRSIVTHQRLTFLQIDKSSPFHFYYHDHLKEGPREYQSNEKEAKLHAVPLFGIHSVFFTDRAINVPLIFELENRFKIPLFDRARTLFRRDNVKNVGDFSDLELYLFSDILLVADLKRQKFNQIQLARNYFQASEVGLLGLAIKGQSHAAAEEFKCGIIFRTEQQRNDWIEMCKSNLSSIHENVQSLTFDQDTDCGLVDFLKGPIDRTDYWIPDSMVERCMILCCNTRFGYFLNRRHHCRGCGFVICSACSVFKDRTRYCSACLCRIKPSEESFELSISTVD